MARTACKGNALQALCIAAVHVTVCTGARMHPAQRNERYHKELRKGPSNVDAADGSHTKSASFSPVEIDAIARALSSSYVLAHINRTSPALSVVDDCGKNGLGTHLNIIFSNAILAFATGRRLIVASELVKSAFHMPEGVLTKRSALGSSGRRQVTIHSHESVGRAIKLASDLHLEPNWFFPDELSQLESVQSAFQAVGASREQSRNGAWLMAVAARWLLASPTTTLQGILRKGVRVFASHCKHALGQPSSTAAVHLRTFADWSCKGWKPGTVECGQCIPRRHALGCRKQWSEELLRGVAKSRICVLVLSDMPSLAEAVVRRLDGPRIAAVSEHLLFGMNASFGARAQNYGGGEWYTANVVGDHLSPSFLGWGLLAGAEARALTSESTFGNSAALYGGIRANDLELDLRCIPAAAHDAARQSEPRWRFEALVGGQFGLTPDQNAQAWTYTKGQWEQRPGFRLTATSQIPRSKRDTCQMRAGNLSEAQAKCRGATRCGVLMDGGVPCDVITGAAQYEYDCPIVPSRQHRGLASRSQHGRGATGGKYLSHLR